MKLGDLKDGQLFRFAPQERLAGYIFEARGNNCFGSLEGYDGGPWHGESEAQVILLTEAETDIAMGCRL